MIEDLFQAEGFGSDSKKGLVGVEVDRTDGGVTLYLRQDGRVHRQVADLSPFCWLKSPAMLDGCPIRGDLRSLEGTLPFRCLASFKTWNDLERVLAWLRKETGTSQGAPVADFFAPTDPVQQYLMQTGETFFRGLAFADLLRMQLDIETRTSPGYDFPNAEREEDRILAIGLSDSSGWRKLLSLVDGSEKDMLESAIRLIRERDPDVLEGHNLFGFDLPYLARRCRLHGIPFTIGRDGSAPSVRTSRFSVADRTLSFPRAEVFGRSVVDTYFLAQIYDVSYRSLPSFGLKDVARHFGLARDGRVVVDASRMGEEFEHSPQRVLDYLCDDLDETRALSGLLSPIQFVQAQILPFSFQSVCLRGTAAKIDALMLREYFRMGRTLPRPDSPRAFAGGYTDIFFQGVARPVHHCDIRSLYPSIMLQDRIGPATDEAHIFLKFLERLRNFRLQAKASAQRETDAAKRNSLDALQSAFKVLINSFYGYLGFEQARFSDFQAAERVAARGREILSFLIGWLNTHGAKPIEIDTDGVYFVPPAFSNPEDQNDFQKRLAEALPQGIEIEFDGIYEAMFSYKMKNYALLSDNGEILIKGAALKSRGLEPFQRRYIRDALGLHLRGESVRLTALAETYRKAITDRIWPIEEFVQTDRLQENPETYAAKRARGECSRNAAYELALASGRIYRGGDPVRYYVTGEKRRVVVYEAARMATQFRPEARDENVAYYLAKLDALVKKFETPLSGEMAEQSPGSQQELKL